MTFFPSEKEVQMFLIEWIPIIAGFLLKSEDKVYIKSSRIKRLNKGVEVRKDFANQIWSYYKEISRDNVKPILIFILFHFSKKNTR